MLNRDINYNDDGVLESYPPSQQRPGPLTHQPSRRLSLVSLQGSQILLSAAPSPPRSLPKKYKSINSVDIQVTACVLIGQVFKKESFDSLIELGQYLNMITDLLID